ncbi:MAG: ABC transporter permease [Chlorobi bacterium]|nr:ABC transporter permease [Chlorobiota bacterium]
MFKNYLISLYRNIIRNRFYSILNIIGLSVGMAAAIFILLFVQDELLYDKYHSKHEGIYRIESDFFINGKNDKFAIVPIPMGVRQISKIQICSFPVGTLLFLIPDISQKS